MFNMLVLLLWLSVSVRGDSVNCGVGFGADGCDTSGLATVSAGVTIINALGDDISCGEYPDNFCYKFDINDANSLLCGEYVSCYGSQISSLIDPFEVTCSGEKSCVGVHVQANSATTITCSGEKSCNGAIFEAKAGQILTVDFSVGSVGTEFGGERSEVYCIDSRSQCTVNCEGDACANVEVMVTKETEGLVTINADGCEDIDVVVDGYWADACPDLYVDGRSTQKSVPVPVEWLYVISALSLILFAVNAAWCFVSRKSRKYAAIKVYDSEDQNQRIAIAQ